MTRRRLFGSLGAVLCGAAMSVLAITKRPRLMLAIVRKPDLGDLAFTIRKAATTDAAAMAAIINDPQTTSLMSDTGWVDVIPRPNFGVDIQAGNEYMRRLKELRMWADSHRG